MRLLEKFLKLENFPSTSKIIIFLISLIFLGYFAFSQKQKSQEITNELGRSSVLVKNFLDDLVDGGIYKVRYISNRLSENGANDKFVAELFLVVSNNSSLETISMTVPWSMLSWLNHKDFHTVDGISGVLKNPVNLSFREYLKTSKDPSSQPFIAEPIYGAMTKIHQLPIAYGAFDRNQNYLGTILFCFDIKKVFNKVESLINNQKIDAALLFKGQIIAKSESFDEEEFLSKNARGSDKIISTQNIFSPNHQFIHKDSLRNHPLEIVLSYKKEEGYSQLLQIFLKNIFLLISTISITTLLLLIIYHRFVKPVKKLSDYSFETLRRNFDYKINPPKNRDFLRIYEAIKTVETLDLEKIKISQKSDILEKKLMAENFNKLEFLSELTHNIRNPLSAAISFSHIIQDECSRATSQEIKEWAKDIENCTTEVLQLVNDLQDINQASLEKDLSKKAKINVPEVIKRSIKLNQNLAQNKKIKINSQISSEVNIADLNPKQFKQILSNLINIFINTAKEGSEIDLITQKISENGDKKLQITIKNRSLITQEQNFDKTSAIYNDFSLVKSAIEAQQGSFAIETVIGSGITAIAIFPV